MSSRLTATAISLLVLGFAACEEASGPLPTSSEILAMKGGNKPGGKDDITVRDVDPDSGAQGQMLEVEVSGSGFDPSSIVDFELNGQPTDDITVQSTTFVSDRKLMADIAVSQEAQEDDFDVTVESLSRGKKGIGLELFQVKAQLIPLSVVLSSGNAVSSDGAGPYVHKEAEALARIFTTGNYGLDLRGFVRGKGKNKTGVDRRVCLTLTERGSAANVLYQGCEDIHLTTNRPDAAHPRGFNDLTDADDAMTTAMRFLWGNETDTNPWLNAAGVAVGQDVWLRYGTQCWDDAAVDWPEVPSEKAVAIVDGEGWKIVASDAYWCGRFPNENHVSVGPDPDGRVSATVEFVLERL